MNLFEMRLNVSVYFLKGLALIFSSLDLFNQWLDDLVVLLLHLDKSNLQLLLLFVDQFLEFIVQLFMRSNEFLVFSLKLII